MYVIEGRGKMLVRRTDVTYYILPPKIEFWGVIQIAEMITQSAAEK